MDLRESISTGNHKWGKTRHQRQQLLTPISNGESDPLITLGAKARGFLDSICLRVARTVSSWIGLLKQSIQAQGSTQYTPAAKHSQ